jgi:hypothetical protein
MNKEILRQVSADRLRRNLFHLCRDPLPFRKVNHTRPGQSVSTLAETDAFIRAQLVANGYEVAETVHSIQPYRCDSAKPLHHWHSSPKPEDPKHDVVNLEVTLRGRTHPDEFIQLISHKDSMSWIDSPGAHDNSVGVIANLELARILAARDLRRSVRVLFCNEEHHPWTSRFAAEAAAARGDNIIAVFNQDGLDGKSDEDMAAGRLTHVACYSTDEGRALAEFLVACAGRHELGLEARTAFKPHVNDDDGMFINAGYRATVMNIGSWPYSDAEYHLVGDHPERVNIDNMARSTQLLLAAILEIDAGGAGVFKK